MTNVKTTNPIRFSLVYNSAANLCTGLRRGGKGRRVRVPGKDTGRGTVTTRNDWRRGEDEERKKFRQNMGERVCMCEMKEDVSVHMFDAGGLV